MRALTKLEKWRKTVLYGLYKQHGCDGRRDSVLASDEFDPVYDAYIKHTKSSESKHEAKMSLGAVLKKGEKNIPKHLGW